LFISVIGGSTLSCHKCTEAPRALYSTVSIRSKCFSSNLVNRHVVFAFSLKKESMVVNCWQYILHSKQLDFRKIIKLTTKSAFVEKKLFFISAAMNPIIVIYMQTMRIDLILTLHEERGKKRCDRKRWKCISGKTHAFVVHFKHNSICLLHAQTQNASSRQKGLGIHKAHETHVHFRRKQIQALAFSLSNKKFELMLTRLAKTYSSSSSVV